MPGKRTLKEKVSDLELVIYGDAQRKIKGLLGWRNQVDAKINVALAFISVANIIVGGIVIAKELGLI